MAASLTFDSVTKRYDTTEALAGIDLTIEAGSFVALVGASGSGKSTLLKTINRLVEPTTGRVLLDGEDVTTRDATAMRRQMGYVFQRIGLFPHMRVGENIAIGPRLVGDNLSRERIGELLEKSEPEDLLKFGLIPEFVGRLPVIASLHDLDVDALVTILQEPKNAIVKQYAKLFELEGVELTFNDEALRAIAERAIKRKTGARGLRSIVEGLLLDTMYDLPDLEGCNEVVIDKDVVEGRKEPIRVFDGEGGKRTASDAA